MLPARENPFAAERIESLLEFDPGWLDLSWEEIWNRAEAMNWRGSVVGPHGSGKTTFLAAFRERLEAREFRVVSWFLNDEKPRPDPSERKTLSDVANDGQSILIIDGAENLGRRDWRQVRQDTESMGGLFVSRHKKGMLPVFLETRTSPAMLAAFAGKLAPGFEFGAETSEQILDHCGGNLREALWVCYDLMAANGAGGQPI